MYIIEYSKQARKDLKKIQKGNLYRKGAKLIMMLQQNPFQKTPGYEKLHFSLGTYARKLNDQHRLVYRVFPKRCRIKILAMWGHYE